jgi:hypothetical protein
MTLVMLRIAQRAGVHRDGPVHYRLLGTGRGRTSAAEAPGGNIDLFFVSGFIMVLAGRSCWCTTPT